MRDLHLHTALQSFVGPLAASRALKLVVLGTMGILGIVFVAYLLGWIDAHGAEELRALVIVPGIPIGAAILSEMALRDGITHRTLLYPLLGPAPRGSLAVIRTLGTAAVLAIFAALSVVLLHALPGRDWGKLPQELLGILLGSTAYVAAFGIIHLLSRRGFIICLTIYTLFDHAVGMLPFALRTIAPSHHLRVLGDAEETFSIPVVLDMPEGTLPGSTAFLLTLAVVALAVTALLFSRKPLAELC